MIKDVFIVLVFFNLIMVAGIVGTCFAYKYAWFI